MTAVVDTDSVPHPAYGRRLRKRHPPDLSGMRGDNSTRPLLRLYRVLRSALRSAMSFRQSLASRSRRARGASGVMPRCCRSPQISPPSAPPTRASPGWSMPATLRMILVYDSCG
jgi:hypothetical protein